MQRNSKGMLGIVDKVQSKYFYYLICVILLFLVDFVRETQTPIWWYPIVNCLGIVMLLLAFREIGFKKLLNVPAHIYTFVCLVAGILVVLFWNRGLGLFWSAHVGPYLMWQAITALLNVWLIGVAAISLIRIKDKNVFSLKVNFEAILCYAAVVLAIIGKSRDWWPVWFLLLFGIYYGVRISNNDLETLYKAIVDGIIVVFCLFQGFAVLARPYDKGLGIQYIGFLCNPNMTALFYVIVLAAILVKLHALHSNGGKPAKCFSYALLCYDLGLTVLTISKTGYIGVFILIICFGFVVIKAKWQEGIGKLFIRGCCLVLVFAIVFPLTYFSVRYIPAIVGHPRYYSDEYFSKTVVHGDPINSEKYVSVTDFFGKVLGRLNDTYAEVGEGTNPEDDYPEDFDPTKDNIVWISYETPIIAGIPRPLNIRLGIYAAYLSHSSWLGRTDGEFEYRRVENGKQVWHEQNTVVHMTYRFGYIVGAISFILLIMNLVKDCKLAKTQSNPYYMLPLFINIVFLWFGVTEVVWLSGQFILTLYFLTRKRPIQNEEV